MQTAPRRTDHGYYWVWRVLCYRGGGERVTNTARGILLGGHTCKHLSALGTRGGRRCSCRVLEGSPAVGGGGRVGGGGERINWGRSGFPPRVGELPLASWECLLNQILLVVKSQTNETSVTRLCICSDKQFEDTSENTQWRKSKQIGWQIERHKPLF